MRCEVPLWRFMRQPIRSTAASARFALVDGQFGMGLSSGNEGHVHRARNRFAVLQAIGYETQCQRLHGDGGLFLGTAVCGHTRKGWNVCEPAAILFTVVFDGQRETVLHSSVRHDSMMPPTRRSYKRGGQPC